MPQQICDENFPLPSWKMGCKCHDISKSAGSQTNSKSSKHDKVTPEFCKNIDEKIYLNDFRLGILGNKKV